MSEMVVSAENQSRLRGLAEQLQLSQDESLTVLLNHYELSTKPTPQRKDFTLALEEAVISHGHLFDL